MNFWSSLTPDRDEHARRVKPPDQACIRCGRAIKPGHGRFVEVTIDGEVLRRGDPRSNGPESQGGSPLGYDCARRLGLGGDYLT